MRCAPCASVWVRGLRLFLSGFENLKLTKRAKPPETLYHYCPNQAFARIVQNETLRLSDLHYSNDTGEGQLISEVLASALSDIPETAALLQYSQMVHKYLLEDYLALGFCLSEDSDSLVQWREYATSGQGVTIGFDSKKLEELAASASLAQFKVEYSPEVQKEFILNLYKHPRVETLLDTTVEELGEDVSLGKQHIQAALFLEMYSWKKPEFAFESEWRILKMDSVFTDSSTPDEHHTPNRIQISARVNELVHYSDVDFHQYKKGLISEVVLGSQNNTNPSALRMKLFDSGFGSVEVRRSTVPIRLRSS